MQCKCILNVNSKHQSFALKPAAHTYHCSSPYCVSPRTLPPFPSPSTSQSKTCKEWERLFPDALIESEELKLLLWIKPHLVNSTQSHSQGEKHAVLLSRCYTVQLPQMKAGFFFFSNLLSILFRGRAAQTDLDQSVCICEALEKKLLLWVLFSVTIKDGKNCAAQFLPVIKSFDSLQMEIGK